MGLEFDAGTESDSDVEQEETCAQGKSAGKTVLAGSSSRDKHARKEAARVRSVRTGPAPRDRRGGARPDRSPGAPNTLRPPGR